MTPKQDSDAEKWLKDNDWDYSKYGDRRGDRSAYDTMMRYEISGLLEWAFDSGRASKKEEVEVLEAKLKGTQHRLVRTEEMLQAANEECKKLWALVV